MMQDDVGMGQHGDPMSNWHSNWPSMLL
jgi:hypothetical protein